MASSAGRPVLSVILFLLVSLQGTTGAGAVVLFTVTFNVSSWPRYPPFIEAVRGNSALKGDVSHGLPVLPAQSEPPTRFFDVVLTTYEAKRITVRIRGDNLYLVGYQPGSSGQWFELKEAATNGKPVIPGSTVLSFTGHYDALAKVSGKNREDTKLGAKQLNNAVISLDKASVTYKEQAGELLVLIQMICEAIRSRTITGELGKLGANSSLSPDARIIELENKWEDLSLALLLQDRFPTCKFSNIVKVPNKMGINNYLQAAEALGIILRPNKPLVCPNGSGGMLQAEELLVAVDGVNHAVAA